MHQYDHATAIASMPTPAAPGTAGFFRDGNPATGTPSTVLTADYMNALMMEIINAVEGAGITLDKEDNTQLLAAIVAISGGAAAGTSGDIKMRAQAAVPSGWLECDGAAVSRATYANLFTAIGVTYGAGDGSTTFNLPDFRGEFPRGWDNGRGVDVGREIGSYQADELKAHVHVVGETDPEGRSDGGNNQLVPDGSGFTNANSGSTGGTETRPRNLAVSFVIKT